MTWPVIETVGLVDTVLILLYYYSKSKLEYWEKRGVKGPKPLPFVGNYKDVFLGKASVSDSFEDAYNNFKDEQVVGLYVGHTPLLVLRDPEIIKTVLIKDFSVFADRTIRTVRAVCNIVICMLMRDNCVSLFRSYQRHVCNYSA